jgi:1-aminocyclopropane-1-carboxylate deaminase/D-cysteine desulfhydrase-like pyridoxal-dependent ACC family enzyme
MSETTLVTGGGPQSNHARITAKAGAPEVVPEYGRSPGCVFAGVQVVFRRDQPAVPVRHVFP